MIKWIFSFVVGLLLSKALVQSYPGVELKSGIINGQNAGSSVKNKATGEIIIENNGQYPYMAAIEFKERHKCGGVVVRTNIILTAASCIDGLDKKDLRVTAGSFKRNDISDPDRQIRKVKLVVNHKNYKRQGPRQDVAVLVLKKPFTINKHLKSIQLPCRDDISEGYAAYYEKLIGKRATVLGWGLPNWKKSENLQEATLKIIKPERCQKMTKLPVKELALLCAIDEPDHKRGHTKGDWGGPLILKSSSKHDVLLGIATFSTEEGNNAPNTRKPFLYADLQRSVSDIMTTIFIHEDGGLSDSACFKILSIMPWD